jgi:hypothetical protein
MCLVYFLLKERGDSEAEDDQCIGGDSQAVVDVFDTLVRQGRLSDAQGGLTDVRPIQEGESGDEHSSEENVTSDVYSGRENPNIDRITAPSRAPPERKQKEIPTKSVAPASSNGGRNNGSLVGSAPGGTKRKTSTNTGVGGRGKKNAVVARPPSSFSALELLSSAVSNKKKRKSSSITKK